MIWTLSQVALGGALGSVLRFATVSAVGAPMATALVNIAGSLVMGAMFIALSPRLGPLLMTGVLGGFTTFSAFSLDAALMLERKEYAAAALYIAVSVAVSIAALFAGLMSARKLLA